MFGKACFDITVQIQRKTKLKNNKYRLDQLAQLNLMRWQAGCEGMAMHAHSPERQQYPGLHQKKHGQINGIQPSVLL